MRIDGGSSKLVLNMQRRFGLYVNARRALPSFGDGLKDAARKALHVMRTKGRTKTAALSGAMVDAKLYVHGDASGAINTIAAPYGNNVPLLTGLGNFGTKIYPRAFAASRYTEVEKPKYAEALIFTDYAITPQEPNYDDTTFSPQTLLPPLPLLLINGSQGTGYGWSSTVLPRNPTDVAQALVDVLAGKKPKRLAPWMGWNESSVEFIGYSGNGGSSWRFTGRVEIVDTSTVTVTELPPDTTLEDLVACLTEMEEAGLINDFEERSTSTISVVVKLKRGAAKDWSEADAIAFIKRPTSKVPVLVETKTENFVTISADGETVVPYKHDGETDPIERYLRDWAEWRFGWYERRFSLMLSDAVRELRLYRCIIACHDAGLPKLLGRLKSRDQLRSEIEIACRGHLAGAGPEETKEIIAHISSLATYKWIAEERTLVEQKARAADQDRAEYESLVASEPRRRAVFAEEAGVARAAAVEASAEIAKIRAAATAGKKKPK